MSAPRAAAAAPVPPLAPGRGTPAAAIAAVGLPIVALPWGNVPTPGVGTVLILPAVAVAVLVAGAVLAAAGRPVTVFSAPLAAAVAAVLAAAVAVFVAPDPALALRLVTTTVLGLAWAVVVTSVGRDSRASAVLVGLVLTVGAVQCAVALPAAARLTSTGGSEVVAGRLTGSFGQPNELGGFAAVVAVLALGVAVTARRPAVVVATSLAATAATAALLLSLSRGAWLGAVLGVVVLAAAATPRARRRLGAALGAAALTLVVLASAAPGGGLVDLVVRRSATVLEPAADPTDQRPDIWREAVRQIRSAPLLGHGPGSFPEVARTAGSAIPSSDVDHAHDLALTTAAETGLVGLGLLVLLVVVGVVAVVRVRRRPPPGARPDLAVAAAAGLAAVLGQGLLDYPLRNAVLAMTTWLLLGLLCAAAHADVDETAPIG